MGRAIQGQHAALAVGQGWGQAMRGMGLALADQGIARSLDREQGGPVIAAGRAAGVALDDSAQVALRSLADREVDQREVGER